jgi:hypothetical protein
MYSNPQNFMKFIAFDNVNYGQFVAKRPKLQIFYLSLGLLYLRLEQDGAESNPSEFEVGVLCIATRRIS